jgi:diguanylate cyclase (GGDEF)-like protein/PAS domain S-box-containing protein
MEVNDFMVKHIIFTASFLISLAVNLFCLSMGIYNIPQHLYYIPILLGVFWYKRTGILLTVFTSCIYIVSVLPYDQNGELILAAVVRSAIFLSVSLMVYILNARNLKNEKSLFNNMERLHTILQSIRDVVIVTDIYGNIEILNPKAEAICTISGISAVNRPVTEVLNVYSEMNDKIILQMPDCQNNTCTVPFSQSGYLITKTGSRKDVEVHIMPVLKKDGMQTGNTIIIRDITEKKKDENEIRFLTYHDKLTGLYNRRYFEQVVFQMDEPSNYPITIMIGDVNGLKLTNDAFGHLAGDRLLVAAAASLRRSLKDKDILARWGGDEFIMLLPNTDMEEANSIIHDINHYNKKTFVDSINLSIALGYAVKYNDGYDMSAVMKQADDMMYKEKLSVSRSVRNRTVNIILQSLYVKNPLEREHSMGVSRLADKLGVILGLGNSDIMDLRVLGQIHDVGKITIEDGILNKPDKLTEDEYEIVTRHSEKGYQIIKASPELMYLAEEVLSHHERYDGTGYPRGLKREEIPKLARILAVADAIESMLSDKPYRKALSMEQIIQELRVNAGTQFDPEVVEASFKILTI